MLLFQTAREIIFYFQHFILVCFDFLGKKTGGARPPRPLPLLRHRESIFELTRKRIGIGNLKSLLVPLFNSVITFLLAGDRTNQRRKP